MEIPIQYPFFPVLIIFVLFLGGWALIHRRRIAKLREIASTLGLQFIEKMPANAESKWYKSIRDTWHMAGTYNGKRVQISGRVESRGKSRHASTMFVAYFPSPLPFKIFVSRENRLFSFFKSIVGIGQIRIGDEDIDKKYYIRGEPVEEVGRYLRRPEIQQSLDELFEYDKYASMNEEGLWIKMTGYVTREDKIRDTLDNLTMRLNRFSHETISSDF